MRRDVDPFIAELSGKVILRHDGSVKVLLVEDSADFAALVQTALDQATGAQFEVVHAERLETAVHCLEEDCYDAMLLDLGLQESERCAAIDSATAIATRLPVIMMTGTEEEGGGDRTSESGVGDYAARQRFDRADLAGAILRAVDRHRRLGCGGHPPVVCRIPNA